MFFCAKLLFYSIVHSCVLFNCLIKLMMMMMMMVNAHEGKAGMVLFAVKTV